MNNQAKIFLALVVGAILGAIFVGGGLYYSVGLDPSAGDQSSEPEPLYWVAPMDPNYKREGPGKSPMGMDLIPVYEERVSDGEAGPGTITISPNVVNNLGVRTAKVKHQSLHTEIVTVGYVKYDEDKLFHIHPRVSGWVDKLYVKAAGDPVRKGEPLYDLYSPELVSAQDEFLLAINRANERLTQAAEDRLGALQIPKSFINKLKKTRRIEQTITFYAPQDGVVDNLNIREGFYVQPGTTMLSVGSLSQVWVEAEVFERQASLVNTNDPVTMTLDYLPGRTWKGKVDYIYPTLDSDTRTVRIRLRFNNPNRALKPNMFAQVTIYTDSAEQLLVIPREALIRTGHQDRVVLALGEGQFKSIEVKVGRLDTSSAEILEGLQEDDSVVTSAQFLIDSESSKTSDFQRMYNKDKIDKPESVWVAGEIQSVNRASGIVTASHEPIDVWDWPSMTMDFTLESNVGMDRLEAGEALYMELRKLSTGDYSIRDIELLSEKDQLSREQRQWAAVDGVVNEIKSNRIVNISRGPIKKWNRPEATMDFQVAEHLSLKGLAPDTEITFIFEVKNGDFEIVVWREKHEGKVKEIESAQGDMRNHRHHSDKGASGHAGNADASRSPKDHEGKNGESSR